MAVAETTAHSEVTKPVGVAGPHLPACAPAPLRPVQSGHARSDVCKVVMPGSPPNLSAPAAG